MLETERLILRRFIENDVEAIFRLRNDAEMMRFIREPQQTREESVRWLNMVSSRWDTEKLGFCAVVEKKSNQVVGWCGLWKLVETNEIEVGYAIDKAFWKKGFASEAAEAFLYYGFKSLNTEQIAAVARPENVASRRVMEKLGMKFNYIGKFYGSDLAHHSITKDEFFTNQKSGKVQ